jgi:hypothetical protein
VMGSCSTASRMKCTIWPAGTPSTPLRVQTTPADHTAETSASGGPSLQNGQAYCFDAFPRRKFRSIKNFLRMFQLQDQTASAVCLAAWRAKPDRLLEGAACGEHSRTAPAFARGYGMAGCQRRPEIQAGTAARPPWACNTHLAKPPC